jgi:hypothetical protein
MPSLTSKKAPVKLPHSKLKQLRARRAQATAKMWTELVKYFFVSVE